VANVGAGGDGGQAVASWGALDLGSGARLAGGGGRESAAVATRGLRSGRQAAKTVFYLFI